MMGQLPAISGWQWIRDGFSLLRRKPHDLAMIFLVYCTFNLVLGMVPVAGGILVLILHPALVTAFMLTCAKVEAAQPATPRDLFSYFRSNKFKRLLGLGCCYLVASILASTIMYLFGGGVLIDALLKANNGELPPDPAIQETVMKTLSLGSASFMILIFPLWFAAPLIAWQDMSVGKAIFFSFFSVLRAIKAFVLYIAICGLIFLFVMVNAVAILALLQVKTQAVEMAIVIPCLMLLALLVHSTYYPSYVQLFGKPSLPPEA